MAWREQVNRAVAALLKHHAVEQSKKDKRDLLGADEDTFQLVVSFKSIPRVPRVQPFRIEVPHPSLTPDEAEVCVFAKDPASTVQSALKAAGVNVTQVIGVQKLKTQYSTYELRRKLMNSYDLFLADRRILDVLGRRLGKHFFQRKRQPLPVNVALTGDKLKTEVDKALASALMYYGKGSSSTIRLASTAQPAKHVSANVVAVIEALHSLAKGWDNVRSLHLKMTQSVALPLYEAAIVPDDEAASSRKRKRETADGEGDDGEAADAPGDSDSEWSDDDPFKHDDEMFARFQEEHGLSSDDDEVLETLPPSERAKRIAKRVAATEDEPAAKKARKSSDSDATTGGKKSARSKSAATAATEDAPAAKKARKSAPVKEAEAVAVVKKARKSASVAVAASPSPVPKKKKAAATPAKSPGSKKAKGTAAAAKTAKVAKSPGSKKARA